MGTSPLLKFVEVLSSPANQGAVLGGRHFDTEHHAVFEVSNDLLELGLDLGDHLGLSAQVNLVGDLSLAGAIVLVNMDV